MHPPTRMAPLRTARTRTARTLAARTRTARTRAALARTALALLTAAAVVLGLAQPAAAGGRDSFHFLRGSATTTPGSVCVDSYVEPSYGVVTVTLDVAVNGELRDSVTNELATSRRAFWTDSIKYERCFDVAAGAVTVTAVATATTPSHAGPVTARVLDQTLEVAEVPPPTAPAAPRRPSVQATGGASMKVNWAAVDDGGSDLTGYELLVSKGGALLRTLETTGTSATLTGLKSRSAYSVTVRARNAVGVSPASPAAGIKLEAAGKPAQPAATATSSSSARVAWKEPTSAGGPPITGYQVRVYSGSKVVKTLDVAPDKRSATVTGLGTLTRYSVDVRAKNGVGYSAPSAKASFTTKDWSAAAKWAAKEYGTFSTVTVSGTGNDVIALPRSAKAGILTARHTGHSKFSVEVQDGDGDTIDWQVNKVGAYAGATLFGMDSWRGKPRQLEITASGDWTIQISAVRTAAELPSAGRADGVFLYSGGNRRLELGHDGHSTFVVHTYASGPSGRNSLVNSYGSYRGTVALKKGPAVVEIVADGSWTAKLR
jgi:Fibronectin type III domain